LRPCLTRTSFIAAAASSSWSQRQVPHPIRPLNVSVDRDGRTDHPWQADFRQQLHDIINEFINNNDGDDADSTYQTKMLQLIDDVLTYGPSLRIDGWTTAAAAEGCHGRKEMKRLALRHHHQLWHHNRGDV
jgi:hypothetical protein